MSALFNVQYRWKTTVGRWLKLHVGLVVQHTSETVSSKYTLIKIFSNVGRSHGVNVPMYLLALGHSPAMLTQKLVVTASSSSTPNLSISQYAYPSYMAS